MALNTFKLKKILIWSVRIYPIFILSTIAITEWVIKSETFKKDVYLLLGVSPLLFIIGFIILGSSLSKADQITSLESRKFDYEDIYEIPREQMDGFKLLLLTGEVPRLTSLSGETYNWRDNATCTENPDHVPPVANCKCGFYGYKSFDDARFEKSLNPESFIVSAEFYGVGFEYERGFRAESQDIKRLFLPKRCQRCKIFPGKIFVRELKFSMNNEFWYLWQVYCGLCKRTSKEGSRATFDEVQEELEVNIVRRS